MSPGLLRTLGGAPGAAFHLAEYGAGPVPLALPPLAPAALGENFLLLLGLPGGAVQGRLLDARCALAPGQLAWLRHSAPIHLAAPSPASCLAWRFTVAALPGELADLLLGAPASGSFLLAPRPASPAEADLLAGVRSCPVGPSLRGLWAAAKLAELLTHLLPAPAEDAAPDSAPDRNVALPPKILSALAWMEARLDQPIGLPELAAAAGQSPAHFSRLFTQALGHGPTSHLRRLRMEHAARLLAEGHTNVTEAALAAGYQSLGQFSRVFSEHHGRPPSAFLPRNNG